jgi:hypothetical protein
MQDNSNEVPSTNVTIAVPDSSPNHGLRMKWEDGFTIQARIEDGSVVVMANEEGLISLARLFLTLANPQVPSGDHWHLDEHNSLEEKSVELIIEKM